MLGGAYACHGTRPGSVLAWEWPTARGIDFGAGWPLGFKRHPLPRGRNRRALCHTLTIMSSLTNLQPTIHTHITSHPATSLARSPIHTHCIWRDQGGLPSPPLGFSLAEQHLILDSVISLGSQDMFSTTAPSNHRPVGCNIKGSLQS